MHDWGAAICQACCSEYQLTGVVRKPLHLSLYHLPPWATPPAALVFSYFLNRVQQSSWPGLWASYLLPAQLRWQACATTLSFYWLRGVSLTFCSDLPWTMILPISASWVAKITDVSYHTWILPSFLHLPFPFSFRSQSPYSHILICLKLNK
jgi:hypothetical protein